MNPLHPIDKGLFFSRKDVEDQRLGELVQKGSLDAIQPDAWHIVGYPDDEGISRNGGRLGASQAPDRIRKYLYSMTPPLVLNADMCVELGNLHLPSSSLEARHQAAESVASAVYRGQGKMICLGGGHDYGWPDANAFTKAFEQQKPLVINFDAHLDVRPHQKGSHSGSPFRQLLEAQPEITFCEIGIQSQCNSRHHLAWLKDCGGHVLTLDEILTESSAVNSMMEFLLPHLGHRRPVFLSIDLDAFSSAYAPGCSQSWPTGLTPQDVVLVLDIIKARADVRAAGFYEVSPPLDTDDRTSRLAALLIHRLLQQSRSP